MPHGYARREDERLLTGRGRFVADIEAPGCLEAAFVRSAVAHGELREVTCAPALEAPGVLGAWSAADLPGLPSPGLPASGPPDEPVLLTTLTSAEAVAGREWPSLVTERVRYAGEAVAVVVGEDRYRAEDGAARVGVRVDPLPAMVTAAAALRGPALFDGLSNVALEGSAGAPIDEAVWRRAAVVVEACYRQQLLLPTPMECRAFLAVPRGQELTVWCSHQMPHRLRRELSGILGWPAGRIRVVAPDCGGAFGSKSATFPEYVVVAYLAAMLGRPVRWIEDRLESQLVATRGRGQDQRVRLAADADGRLLAYELTIDADVGAYPHLGAGLPMQTAKMATGPYTTPLVHATVRSVLTNTMMTYPYRGAGRPEAATALERTMEELARRLGMDPAELRRRNLIPPGRFPYDTPTGRRYDSGDYAAALALALRTLDYDRWRAERDRRRADPDAPPLGIGLSCYVERSGGEPGGLHEFGGVEACPDGTVVARCGSASTGQSHETTFSALVADTLGLDPALVRLIEGDTGEVADGMGSFASRTAQIGGAALRRAAETLVEQARLRAATLWELPVDQVLWSAGTLRPARGVAPTLGLGELVRATGPLRVDERCTSGMAFPFGTHAAVVEVDVDLGAVRVLRLVAVDDCGVALNPAAVHGQALGSAVQGIGQALYEGVPYDDDGAPLLPNGLLDYLLPTFAEVPPIEIASTSTPSPVTPLGAKGAGESGCIGTPAAVVNAVADALRVADPGLLRMPLTPDVVWRAARAPKAGDDR
ncbi:xanthine dehydrogenase family protein molybdopterin-binding subunit [Sphaerisporangium sp. TRM90804]|uniref:xanthine dehydrogenase family protein molybdopterin-binding subunit n=1 Tax=Sphaerisporangium sp. TRM90804 TaxID=3031113 RepID=UPI002448DAE0|nr:xanthine dehydrogenase family protein molybdopterin-binding subunit [Sphaerisporangium sp. TRM90804]MDH2424448.1 xanthine dehydrogenase family protein molybdopterin-binding subunit [Sphaerisporangium sp. TRM90804]